MSTATPNSAGGYAITPIALFVLSTTMASATATAVAFMLFSTAQSDDAPRCACSCELPESAAPAADVTEPTPKEVNPQAWKTDVDHGGLLDLPGQETGTAKPKEDTKPKPVRQSKSSRVKMSDAKVKGSLDSDIIRRIVRAHINEVRYCYNQGLASDPELEGKVAVQFTVGPTGKVPVAVVATSTLDDDDTATCITKAVKRWKFPKPEGGGNVVVTYPFVLQPG